MSKIKFYQIVIPDNPISMEYHELSKKSFEPVNDIIEIVPFEAITPHHPDFEEHESRYNWQHLLSHDSRHKSKDFDKPHSPTERAGMCSHWELIRQRSLTDEPFFVTEHDTYLLPEGEDSFRESLELWEDYNLHYANIGLYMGCYSLSRTFAEQATILLNNEFPINGGPYGCMERLFKTFLTGSHVTKPFEVTEDFRNKEKTFLHPVEEGEGGIGLRLGKSQREMHKCYNAAYIKPIDLSYQIERPTTQMIKKSLGSKSVTQHHQAYDPVCIENPWQRPGRFHFID
jgi:hypothetical protein